jgi:hypothetical protein
MGEMKGMCCFQILRHPSAFCPEYGKDVSLERLEAALL